VLVAHVEGDDHAVGIVRFVREGERAEVAFEVTDEYQRRGWSLAGLPKAPATRLRLINEASPRVPPNLRIQPPKPPQRMRKECRSNVPLDTSKQSKRRTT